jgi:hypothetical protein
MLVKLNKSVDRFPENESIWKYYTGSQELFTSLINNVEKTKLKSVQFSEVTSEYAFETGGYPGRYWFTTLYHMTPYGWFPNGFP